MLSWHMQNLVVITSLQFWIQLFPWNWRCEWKVICKMDPWGSSGYKTAIWFSIREKITGIIKNYRLKSNLPVLWLLMHLCIHKLGPGGAFHKWYYRDHLVYAPSQWETTLHCDIVSHWLATYTKWSLLYAPSQWGMTLHCNILSHWLGTYTEWSLWYQCNSNFRQILHFCTIHSWPSICNKFLHMPNGCHAKQVPSQNLNQWWPSSLMQICVTSP